MRRNSKNIYSTMKTEPDSIQINVNQPFIEFFFFLFQLSQGKFIYY